MTRTPHTSNAEGTVDGALRIRVRARLAYDGTDFSGWAVQPGRRTVQGEVEEALTVALRHHRHIRVVCAGRTDAGVHARDQHIHADIDRDSWHDDAAEALRRRINGLMAADVRMLALAKAQPGFDARFSVTSRQYRYHIADGRDVDPLARRFVVAHRHPLDLAKMNAAAELLLGEHDFAALCRHRPEASTVRRLLELQWVRGIDGNAELIVRADAFCHSMVRSLVGLLLAVGGGRRDIDWASQVVAGRRRIPEVTVMPAHGLVLERVQYAADVARQGQAARRVRGEVANPVR